MAQHYEERIGEITVSVDIYDRGLKDLVLDRMFERPLRVHAIASMARAKAITASIPTRFWGKAGSQRRTQLHYADSFDTDIGYGVTADGTVRIRARLINTNPFAMYIEYGNANIKPARRIVRRAAGIYRFDAEGDKY